MFTTLIERKLMNEIRSYGYDVKQVSADTEGAIMIVWGKVGGQVIHNFSRDSRGHLRIDRWAGSFPDDYMAVRYFYYGSKNGMGEEWDNGKLDDVQFESKEELNANLKRWSKGPAHMVRKARMTRAAPLCRFWVIVTR